MGETLRSKFNVRKVRTIFQVFTIISPKWIVKFTLSLLNYKHTSHTEKQNRDVHGNLLDELV